MAATGAGRPAGGLAAGTSQRDPGDQREAGGGEHAVEVDPAERGRVLPDALQRRARHVGERRCAVDGSGRPHAFLCWTFGSDKEEHWPAIEPTIGGYQSRFMRTYDNKFKLTDIGRYLDDKS